MAKGKEEVVDPSTIVTVIAVAEKRSKLITGQEYEVTKEIADILVKAKRAKLK